MTLFEETSSRYRCCCNSVRATTGATTIGVLNCIGISLSLGLTVYHWIAGPQNVISLSVSLGLALIFLLAVILLFVGICKCVGGLLVPYMICQVLTIVVLLVLATFYICLAAGQLQPFTSAIAEHIHTVDMSRITVDPKILFGVAAGSLLVSVAVEIWFFAVVIRAFWYLRDKRRSCRQP